MKVNLLVGLLLAPFLILLADVGFGVVFLNESTILKWQLIKQNLNNLNKPKPPFVSFEEKNKAEFQKFPLVYDRLSTQRSNPTSEQPASFFNLFFGASPIYGLGVDEKDSIPSLVEQSLNHFRSYNYSIPGSSPIQALTLAARRSLPMTVTEKSGIVILQISKPSFFRIHGYPTNVNWLPHAAWITKNDEGQPGFQGTLSTHNPMYWFLLKWLNLSSINFVFTRANWSIFFRPQTEALCLSIKELHKLLLQQLKVENFYLLKLNMPLDYNKAIDSCLQQSEIKSISLTTKPVKECYLRNPDRHLSAMAYKEIADKLKELIPEWKQDSKKNLTTNYSCL